MNNRGRNRRPGMGNQPRSTVRQSLGLLKSAMHGHANKLRGTNPPQFSRLPYNTVTLGQEYSPSESTPDVQTETVATIITALKAQLGLTDQGIRAKILRIDLWALPGIVPSGLATLGVNPEITAKFFSLIELTAATSGSGAISEPVGMKELEDIGVNGQSAAVVSYTWPKEQQDIPCRIPSTGNAQEVVTWTVPAGVKVYFRAHLHWSPIGTSNIEDRYAMAST